MELYDPPDRTKWLAYFVPDPKRVGKTLSDLRKRIEQQVPDARDLVGVFERAVYRLHPTAADSDVYEFLRALDHLAERTTPLDEAIALYERAREVHAGPLLGGLDQDYEWLHPADGPALDEQYDDLLDRAAETLARRAAAAGRPDLAAAFYERLLEQNPLKEDLVRQQLHCFAAMDDLRGLENAVFSLRRAMHHAWGQPDDDVWSERYNASPVTEKLYRKLVAEVRARRGQPAVQGEAGRSAAFGAPRRHR